MLELEVQIRVIHGWIKRRSSSRLKPSRATTLYRLDHHFCQRNPLGPGIYITNGHGRRNRT